MKRKRTLILTATTVLALCTVCGLWLHKERQQYARNRALIAALEHNEPSVALALVNVGADPNTRERAAPAPSLKLLVSRLLHHSPPPVNDSPTALHLACCRNWSLDGGSQRPVATFPENLPLLQAMLSHGADVRATTDNKQNALHLAAFVGRWHTVELLLKHGADANAKSSLDLTPLILAACSDEANNARLLLARGANPNAQDTRGFTALHFALNSKAAKSLILELLTHGADPNLRSKAGRSPLDYARKMKRSDLVLLLTRGAK